ncbi:MAG: glycine--tRNA ligase subunit alpha [Terracidiphilus sp.]
MKKRQGAGGVVLAGKIKVAGLNNYVDLSYEAVIKMLMLKIEYDGFAWNVGKNPNAVLQTDCVVHVGELDTFAPADDRSPMSRFMRDRSTKGRQSGVNYFFDVQESSTVDAELFNQIKILDCATVSDSNAKTLERKGINKNNIAYLQKLRREVWPIHNGRKIGYKVAERCVIDRLNHITYGDVRLEEELQFSVYNFEYADVPKLWEHFNSYEAEAQKLLEQAGELFNDENATPKAKKKFPLLATYELALKCSNLFNLLDARGAISVTERVGVIGRIRNLAVGVAKAYAIQQAAG